MANKYTTAISGSSLASLMGVDRDDYIKEYQNNAYANNFISGSSSMPENDEILSVVNFLSLNEIIGLPTGTRRVKSKDISSGDIWYNQSSKLAFLYIGKKSDGKDVVFSLNDGDAEGKFIEDIVNGKNSQLYFDKQIFQAIRRDI